MAIKSLRKPLVAGNWKMFKNSAEGEELALEINEAVLKYSGVQIVICPPFTALERISTVLGSSTIKLGAQNMHPEISGAFTGEVSPEMLRHLFVTYVVLGHSERRQIFKESDEFINEKVLSALKSNLRPILCVGETLQEREAGKTLEVVAHQLKEGLKGVTKKKANEVVIAYEPVWAIGTGVTASPEQAQEVHAEIRKLLAELFDEKLAEKILVLYGGSVKPQNALELFKQPDIDGGLIGGASLEARSFLDIVEAAHQIAEEQ